MQRVPFVASRRKYGRFAAVSCILWCGLWGASWLPNAGSAALAAEAAKEQEEEGKPEDITLKTKDGLELKATFYPTTLKKKEKQDAVPIVILHAWKGDRGDCEELAEFLQDQGHAVITPDLRGHGESTQIIHPDGTKVKLEDANKLKPDDFRMMVTHDMETIKDFLVQKNNAAELNIERLGVVGSEMGAVVALNWAAVDWGWPVLATGKQGQDVKALVLISPEWNFKGLAIAGAMQDPNIRSELSMLIIAGKGSSKALGDAKKLKQTLEKFHDPAKKDLFCVEKDTKLQGSKLLNEKSLNLNEMIANFVRIRLVEPKYAWDERKDPLK